MDKWYLVRKMSYYDREWIEIEQFITKHPDKFKSSDKFIDYDIELIKVK